MEVTFTDNTDKKRFEAQVDGKLALIDYIRTADKIYLTHTEVPPELEGKGIASAMVKKALQRIEGDTIKLVPLCPFIAGYVKRHPEFRSLLAQGYTI